MQYTAAAVPFISYVFPATFYLLAPLHFKHSAGTNTSPEKNSIAAIISTLCEHSTGGTPPRLVRETSKNLSKAPKIQRLVTPLTLQRKRARIADKKKRIAKAKAEAAEYQKLLATRLKEQRERRSESLAKKRSRLLSAKPSIAV
ncbi:40S ribosomal protein S6-like [Forsythia ovata]|uniref:40S ribosomal protein S6-like n=1 Tax=Forsythia ovata TaxID=205694 RepID=A0ABD1QM85_9LAMI